jgi:hypothetical protein
MIALQEENNQSTDHHVLGSIAVEQFEKFT